MDITKLGDNLETVFVAIGAKQTVSLIERLTGNDCGCAKRKQHLNEIGERFAKAWNSDEKPSSL